MTRTLSSTLRGSSPFFAFGFFQARADAILALPDFSGGAFLGVAILTAAV